MGCVQSTYYARIYETVPRLANWKQDFETLQFAEGISMLIMLAVAMSVDILLCIVEDIGALYGHFKKVDVSIFLSDIYIYIYIERDILYLTLFVILLIIRA